MHAVTVVRYTDITATVSNMARELIAQAVTRLTTITANADNTTRCRVHTVLTTHTVILGWHRKP